MAHDRENMCALCFLLILKENSSMPVDPFQLGTVMFNSIVYLVPHCKKAGGENRHSTCLPPSPSIKEMGISALSSSFFGSNSFFFGQTRCNFPAANLG